MHLRKKQNNKISTRWYVCLGLRILMWLSVLVLHADMILSVRELKHPFPTSTNPQLPYLFHHNLFLIKKQTKQQKRKPGGWLYGWWVCMSWAKQEVPGRRGEWTLGDQWFQKHSHIHIPWPHQGRRCHPIGGGVWKWAWNKVNLAESEAKEGMLSGILEAFTLSSS